MQNGKTSMKQGLELSELAGSGRFRVNEAGSSSQIDAQLTHPGSLDVLARHLIRLRPSYGSKQRRFISDLAEQCKNYEAGNAHLARRMLETIDLIQSK
jgi:hypothetical protein